jgi:hypothetical protein
LKRNGRSSENGKKNSANRTGEKIEYQTGEKRARKRRWISIPNNKEVKFLPRFFFTYV